MEIGRIMVISQRREQNLFFGGVGQRPDLF